MIKIVQTCIYELPELKVLSADLEVDVNGVTYSLTVGGLDPTADVATLQKHLDSRAAELMENAVLLGHAITTADRTRQLAESQATAIPNWAHWTEQQVIDYINTNVTSLATAKVVLVALARMVVALRNETWPGLQQ